MILQMPPKISVLRWLGEALRLLVQRFGVWLGASFLLYAVSAGATMIFAFCLGSSGGSRSSGSSGSGWAFLVGWDILHSGFYLLFAALLSGNGIALAVRQVRGEPIRLGDLFRPGPNWGRLVGYHTVSGLLALLGYILLVLPGVFLMTWFLPAPALVAVGANVFEAAAKSMRVMGPLWLRAFGLVCFLCLLTAISVVPMLLGLLVLQPLWWLVTAVAERDLFQPSTLSSDFPDYGMAQSGVWPPPPVIPP